jgi:hypothetical protein
MQQIISIPAFPQGLRQLEHTRTANEPHSVSDFFWAVRFSGLGVVPASAQNLPHRLASRTCRCRAMQSPGPSFPRRQMACDVMVGLDPKKIMAPDFTVSIRPGTLPLWSSMKRLSRVSTWSRASPVSTGRDWRTISNTVRKSPALPSPTQNLF